MNLSSRRERSFFLAQAFTPGNRESNGFSAPFRGLVLRRAEKPPGRGLHSVWVSSNPGVNAWATEKTERPMFQARSLMNNPGEVVP